MGYRASPMRMAAAEPADRIGRAWKKAWESLALRPDPWLHELRGGCIRGPDHEVAPALVGRDQPAGPAQGC